MWISGVWTRCPRVHIAIRARDYAQRFGVDGIVTLRAGTKDGRIGQPHDFSSVDGKVGNRWAVPECHVVGNGEAVAGRIWSWTFRSCCQTNASSITRERPLTTFVGAKNSAMATSSLVMGSVAAERAAPVDAFLPEFHSLSNRQNNTHRS